MSIEITGQTKLDNGKVVYRASVDGERQEFVSSNGDKYVMERIKRDRESEAKFQEECRHETKV